MGESEDGRTKAYIAEQADGKWCFCLATDRKPFKRGRNCLTMEAAARRAVHALKDHDDN